jgi:hypothetical protein
MPSKYDQCSICEYTKAWIWNHGHVVYQLCSNSLRIAVTYADEEEQKCDTEHEVSATDEERNEQVFLLS